MKEAKRTSINHNIFFHGLYFVLHIQFRMSADCSCIAFSDVMPNRLFLFHSIAVLNIQTFNIHITLSNEDVVVGGHQSYSLSSVFIIKLFEFVKMRDDEYFCLFSTPRKLFVD